MYRVVNGSLVPLRDTVFVTTGYVVQRSVLPEHVDGFCGPQSISEEAHRLVGGRNVEFCSTM